MRCALPGQQEKEIVVIGKLAVANPNELPLPGTDCRFR
jgi:LEA14-like dessication related protein